MNRSLLTIFSIVLLYSIDQTIAASWKYQNDDGEVEGGFFFFAPSSAPKNTSNELNVEPSKRCTRTFLASTCRQTAIIEKRNDNLRNGTKILLLAYGGMMLKGKLALQSLLCSMATVKLIHQSDFKFDASYEFENVSWTIISWISLLFSGSAAISNWMVDQMEKAASVSTNPSMILSTLRIGARGTELIGGTTVLFLLFLSL